MARYGDDYWRGPPRRSSPPRRAWWHDRQAPDAFGYRGPGTDLGEDIRRGYVERGGYRGGRSRYDHEEFRGYALESDWGRPLRGRPADPRGSRPPPARYDQTEFRGYGAEPEWGGPLRRRVGPIPHR